MRKAGFRSFEVHRRPTGEIGTKRTTTTHDHNDSLYICFLAYTRTLAFHSDPSKMFLEPSRSFVQGDVDLFLPRWPRKHLDSRHNGGVM